MLETHIQNNDITKINLNDKIENVTKLITTTKKNNAVINPFITIN